MPLSKQRNKLIQRVLVEAAKLAPRECHELAMVRQRELDTGNQNRATLAVVVNPETIHLAPKSAFRTLDRQLSGQPVLRQLAQK